LRPFLKFNRGLAVSSTVANGVVSTASSMAVAWSLASCVNGSIVDGVDGVDGDDCIFSSSWSSSSFELELLRASGAPLLLSPLPEAPLLRGVRSVVLAHDLLPLLDQVIAGDSLPTKKPDPAGVLHCLHTFGLAPEQALFVGDSSIDAATARNAGVPVWLLPYGYNMGQAVQDCNPDRVIDRLDALLRAP
jgi:hypothetical protein